MGPQMGTGKSPGPQMGGPHMGTGAFLHLVAKSFLSLVFSVPLYLCGSISDQPFGKGIGLGVDGSPHYGHLTSWC